MDTGTGENGLSFASGVRSSVRAKFYRPGPQRGGPRRGTCPLITCHYPPIPNETKKGTPSVTGSVKDVHESEVG